MDPIRTFDEIVERNEQRSQPVFLQLLEKRQSEIMAKLPDYLRVTALTAIIGFVITSAVQWFFGGETSQNLSFPEISELSIGSIIAFVLTLLAVLIVWLFVIWSVSFIPFIAFHAHKSSRKFEVPVGTRAFRWIQLYTATFLPMAVFAVAWNSFATLGNDIEITISTVEIAILTLGVAGVTAGLWFINRYIPGKYLALRVSLLSVVLYASLFLTYGRGYSLASYSVLFGILVYIAIFGSDQLEEVGRRIATYDIDPVVADRLDETTNTYQQLQSKYDEMYTKELESDALRQENEQIVRLTQIENETNLNMQLAEIRKSKADFNQLTNETQLKIYQAKLDALKQMYEVLSAELSDRIKVQIPQSLDTLRTQAQGYSARELQTVMAQIMNETDAALEGLPESLENLRTRMLEATREIEQHTILLADEATRVNES